MQAHKFSCFSKRKANVIPRKKIAGNTDISQWTRANTAELNNMEAETEKCFLNAL